MPRTMRAGRVGAVGCAVLALALTVSGCKKEEPVVDQSETATEAPTPVTEPTVTTAIAAATLSGPGGASGVVNFTQEAGAVHVVARIQGAPAGTHGFHLHAGGTCDGPDFKSAGDHFNPGNTPHGAPDAPQHHAGDFGNIEVGADGTGNLDLTTTMLSVGDGGATDVVGKALILHGGKDDLTTQPSGNSGARIACGVVQKAEGEAIVEPSVEPGASPMPTAVY
jgi:superoxide dismutase, Cu-Zn family